MVTIEELTEEQLESVNLNDIFVSLYIGKSDRGKSGVYIPLTKPGGSEPASILSLPKRGTVVKTVRFVVRGDLSINTVSATLIKTDDYAIDSLLGVRSGAQVICVDTLEDLSRFNITSQTRIILTEAFIRLARKYNEDA